MNLQHALLLTDSQCLCGWCCVFSPHLPRGVQAGLPTTRRAFIIDSNTILNIKEKLTYSNQKDQGFKYRILQDEQMEEGTDRCIKAGPVPQEGSGRWYGENKKEIPGQKLESSAWRNSTNWPWLGITYPVLPEGAAKLKDYSTEQEESNPDWEWTRPLVSSHLPSQGLKGSV